MSRQIIKQPNGKYAIFSSVVDAFTILDATPEEIIGLWTEEEAKRIREQVSEIIAALDSGRKPYHQFTMDFKEAYAIHERTQRAQGKSK